MQTNKLQLPQIINDIIGSKTGSADTIGMSSSSVIIYDEFVLKIEKLRQGTDAAVNMMRWLDGKLPTPKVICYEKDSASSYLLMSKVKGEMSCSQMYLDNSDLLVQLLADGLKMLWQIDTSDCPRKRDLDTELAEAKYRVENNLVALDNVDPATFGKNGFASPAHLLEWLFQNKPTYEPVLSHGDYCLPNVFINDGKISGFIDLGDCGIGDKWRDIALCYRSLKNNFNGTYGGKVYENFSPELLFEKLGIKPNHEKLRYYLLLDELF